MFDPFHLFPSCHLTCVVLFLYIHPLLLFGSPRLRLELNVHTFLPAIIILRPTQARRQFVTPLIGNSLSGWKLIREYLDEILKHKPHSIMQIPNLPDHILGCLFGDILMNLNVHVAVDEIVGIDLCVIVHFVVFELRHLNLYR